MHNSKHPTRFNSFSTVDPLDWERRFAAISTRFGSVTDDMARSTSSGSVSAKVSTRGEQANGRLHFTCLKWESLDEALPNMNLNAVPMLGVNIGAVVGSCEDDDLEGFVLVFSVDGFDCW